MQLKIKNCNNIENGEFDITEGRLNIKYAINGTGKSTISKAIEAFVTNDQEKKNLLLPFKYYGVEEENSPELIGYDQFKKVSVFNEKYIEDYVYQQNELIKNSFEIFVKSPDYDTHIKEIEKLLESINITFQNHPELEELIKVFQQFIDGFGKAKSGYSAAGAIGKGIGKGNKLDNIPVGLEVYEPYLKNNDNVKWIKWQLEGKHYLDMAEQCPYCSGSIKETKETILKVSEEYDAKAVEQLTKMLEVFKELMPYFTNETAVKIEEITKNVSGITNTQKNYLLEIKAQMDKLVSKIAALGIPGLVLVTAIGATGLAGGAAITTALAALGPGGILGGIATLGIIGLISEGIAQYGVDAIFSAVIKELYRKGETKEEILRKIKKYPISKELKRKLKENIEKV